MYRGRARESTSGPALSASDSNNGPTEEGEPDNAGRQQQGTRTEGERFKSFTYEDLLKRDKVNLDIFWLKDEALEESANLPAPEIIAQEIRDDLEAALEQFAEIPEDLNSKP